MIITPEQAREALVRPRPQPLSFQMRRMFEAFANNRAAEYYLKKLVCRRAYSDTFSDDDPPVLADYGHPEHDFLKCRANCIMGLIGCIRAVDERGYLDDDPALHARLDEFYAHDWNALKGRKGEFFTTPDEIDLMNRTLDAVIARMNEEVLKELYSTVK